MREFAKTTADTHELNVWPTNGQWDLAAAAFGKLVEQEPDNLGSRYAHIRSLEKAGDRPGVQCACEDLLKWFPPRATKWHANFLAWSCVLTPNAVVDSEGPRSVWQRPHLPNIREEGKDGSDVLNTIGAALYLAGRFEEAIRRLSESIQALDGEDVPKGFAFLATARLPTGAR